MTVQLVQGVKRWEAGEKIAEFLLFQFPLQQQVHDPAIESQRQKTIGDNGDGGMHGQPQTL